MYHSYSTVLTTGAPDCYACHGQASNFTSWALADRVPNSTTPPVLTAKREFQDGFDHAARYGTECASCHTNVPANVGTSWKAPFFNHMNNNATSLGTCSPCHDTRQHHAGELCTRCHTISWPRAAPASTKGWSGGDFGGT
jgi:hypothetical protein